jgi:hypothetical protein
MPLCFGPTRNYHGFTFKTGERQLQNRHKETIMKTRTLTNLSSTNSFVATAFGIVVTMLLIGGYEVTHSDTINEAVFAGAQQGAEVVKLDTIVVTGKRIPKA